ncbi:MAG TPA: hypothetical protein VGM90_18915 [Kofleriaceae bacterium]|jgi:hypothetical protein
MSRTVIGASALGALFAFSACPSPVHPAEAPAGSQTVDVGATGYALRGAASDGTTIFTSLAKANAVGIVDGTNGTPPATFTTTFSARRGATVAWTKDLEGRGGPMVVSQQDPESARATKAQTHEGSISGSLVIAAIAGSGTVAGASVRGEPGAAIVGLDPAGGTVGWRVALESNEWITVTSMAARPDGGAIIGGAFSATLRVGDRVVESGGRSDGFVLTLNADGSVAWLWRMGGTGADSVQGVAVRDGDVAIAGVYMNDAEFGGVTLPAFDEKTPNPDAFVGVIDERTAVRKWSQTFGGLGLEEVAGVAIDQDHHVAVAATVRGELTVSGRATTTSGPADGLVAWWNNDGSAHTSVLLGGADFDGLRAITAAGTRVVVGGFYSGSMRLGGETISADGGDDAFLAALDATGHVVHAWPASGPGREELVTLSSVPGGFLVGAAYTATANIAGAQVKAPADPLSGAAVAIRPVP